MKGYLFLPALAGLLLGSPAPPAQSRLQGDARGFVQSPALADRTGAVPRLPILPFPDDQELAVSQWQSAPAETSQLPAHPPADREGVAVVISIPEQKAYVFEDGALFGTSPVSTGKRGHATPAGSFTILQKRVDHRSNRYSNAPMPYMQRLTWQGIALHAGHLPGYPASHGCIRLPRGFAKKLYGLTDFDTKVVVTHQKPGSAKRALSLI